MAYIDSKKITVEATLTKLGRLRLAQGNFNITQFALGDDEVDYTLFNPNHPNGTASYGEAIESTPLLQAFTDESQLMQSKLITLERGTKSLPTISVGLETITLKLGATFSLNPQTLNFAGSTSAYEPSGYAVTVNDTRLLSVFNASGLGANVNKNEDISAGSSISKTLIGLTFTLTATNTDVLFVNGETTLNTTVTIVGKDSGARLTVGLYIRKQ